MASTSTRQVRNSYPDELVRLAVYLASLYPTREIATLLGVPLSSLYRWAASHKRRTPAAGTQPAEDACELIRTLVETCESYGFDVRHKVTGLFGIVNIPCDGVETLSSNSSALHRVRMPAHARKILSHPISGVSANDDEVSPRVRKQTNARISAVKADIDARYFASISCHELGHSIGMSRFNFIKRFSAAYGVSPYRYLQSVRVRHAKRMLISVNRPLEDIAIAVGFESASSLARAFKSIEGVSLSSYCRGVRFEETALNVHIVQKADQSISL